MKIMIKYLLLFLVAGSTKVNSVEDLDKLYIEETIRKLEKKVKTPAFTLRNLYGEEIKLDDYKGEVLFLNFWASWCPPCVKEMPSIENLFEKTKDKDIEIVAINIGESLDIAKGFIDNVGFTFEVLLDETKVVASSFGVRNIPTTYIIDKQGSIVALKIGVHEWDNDSVVEILETLAKEE